jgi:hypothetical protein
LLNRALFPAAAALLMAATPAMAASTASAQLTGVNLQLIDLNPSDGIAPSVVFLGGASRGESSINFTQPGRSGSESTSFTGLGGPWSPGSASVSGDFGSAAAVLTGSGTPTGATISVSGSATEPGGGYCLSEGSGFNTCFNAQAGYSAQAQPAGFFGDFQLSPNTVMIVTMDAALSVAATGGGLTQQFDSFPFTNSDSASANVNLSVSGPGPTGSGSQSSSDGRFLSVFASYDFGSGSFIPASDALNSGLGVSFSNLSSGTLNGSFSLSLGTNGTAYGDALLVPEPGAWALMLAGLAAVAAVARRRA